MIKWTAIFAVIALAAPATCFADDAANPFFSSEFLKTYNWKDEEPIDRASRDWPHFNGDQSGDNGIKDRTILKTKSVDIGGLKFDGSVRKINSSGQYEVVFVSSIGDYKSTPQNLNYCNNLIAKYTFLFGAPKNLADVSDDASVQDFAIIDEKAYWDINQTRILVHCAASKVYAGFIPIIAIALGDKNNVEQVYDAVFLKCDRKKIGLGRFSSKEATEEPPFTLLIDQNMKQLKSRTANIGKTTSYGERTIVAIMKNEKKNIEG